LYDCLITPCPWNLPWHKVAGPTTEAQFFCFVFVFWGVSVRLRMDPDATLPTLALILQVGPVPAEGEKLGAISNGCSGGGTIECHLLHLSSGSILPGPNLY